MYFDSIPPFPLLLLNPPSLPPLHTHPPLSFLFFFCPSLSLICVVQLLLGVGPALECGHPARGHTIKDNLLFLPAEIRYQ